MRRHGPEANRLRAALDAFVERLYVGREVGQTMRYFLFVPPAYHAAHRYPLVLYLHTAAGRSAPRPTLNAFVGAGVFALPEVQARQPSFVVAPVVAAAGPALSRADSWTGAAADSQGRAVQPPELSDHLRLALEIVDVVRQEFPIDPRRLYVTGFSMGAYGVWDLITRFPRRFAAAVPISGAGDPRHAGTARDTPVWAFHGDRDAIVPLVAARSMIEAHRRAGGSPCYTEYVGGAHRIAFQAYREPDLPAWLFGQRRPLGHQSSPSRRRTPAGGPTRRESRGQAA